MKRLLPFLAVLACACTPPPQRYGASLAPTQVTATTTTQNLTGSAPTLSTDGVDITQADGFLVVVSATSGQTITGGSLLCYYYGPVSTGTASSASTFRWMRCPTSLDFTPATGARDAPSGDLQPLVGFGRIFYMPSSVTVSSGTTVDVTVAVRRPL